MYAFSALFSGTPPACSEPWHLLVLLWEDAERLSCHFRNLSELESVMLGAAIASSLTLPPFTQKAAITREYLTWSLWALLALCIWIEHVTLRLSTMGFLFLSLRVNLKNVKKSHLAFVVCGTCQSGFWSPEQPWFVFLTDFNLLSITATTGICLNRIAWQYLKFHNTWIKHCISRISCALTSGKYIRFVDNLVKNTLAQVTFPLLRPTKVCLCLWKELGERRVQQHEF